MIKRDLPSDVPPETNAIITVHALFEFLSERALDPTCRLTWIEIRRAKDSVLLTTYPLRLSTMYPAQMSRIRC